MRKKYRSLIALIIICFTLSQGVVANAEVAIKDRNIEYIQNVMEMVLEKYNGQITEDELVNGALAGIFSTMDKYSQFIEKDNDYYMNNITGSYVGVGISFIKVTQGIQLVDVFKNSPASFAGLKQNDIIVEVDNISIKDMDSQSIAAIIKGEEGTNVVVKVVRDDLEIGEIELVRAKIDFNPVSYRINNDIAYIKIDAFQKSSLTHFKDAMVEVNALNIKKIILDLRGNGGGDVDTCVKIAREILPEGLITKIDFKSDSMQDNQFYSYNRDADYKIAVLVDGGTASASEILAGAIQDSGIGVLIGTKTYGKGIVQTVFPILTPEAFEKYKNEENVEAVNSYDLFMKTFVSPKDSEIIGWGQMTTGHYLTRNGRMINGIGLEPDFVADAHEIINGIEIDNIDFLSSEKDLSLNMQNSDILNVEKILKILGYDIKEIDMKYDEQTFKAISMYQSKNLLKADGIIGKKTKEILNKEIEDQRIKIDKHYGTAVELLNIFK